MLVAKRKAQGRIRWRFTKGGIQDGNAEKTLLDCNEGLPQHNWLELLPHEGDDDQNGYIPITTALAVEDHE